MPTEALLNFDALRKVVPGELPAGPNLREDYSPTSVYQQLKSARELSRDVERKIQQGFEDYTVDQLEWSTVMKLGPQVLEEQSKDLEIAAWTCEALVRFHGYAGLRDGFRMAREMLEKYWKVLYPLPDEDGVEIRVAAFAGLDGGESRGALVEPICAVPLTEQSGYSQNDLVRAKDLEKMSDVKARQERIEQGAVTLSAFNADVDASSADFYRTLREDLRECVDEYAKLTRRFEEMCGKDEDGLPLAPPSSNIQKALAACLATVEELASRKGLDAPEPEEEPEASQGNMQVQAQAPSGDGAGAIHRDQALAMLSKLADFFRRTEPHSPISYHIDEAVRWAKMSLPELLAELIEDKKTREPILKRVGILEDAEEEPKGKGKK